MGFMLGFGFQAWLLGLKPMGFGFRPPHVKPLQGAKCPDAGLSSAAVVPVAPRFALPIARASECTKGGYGDRHFEFDLA